MKHKPPVCCTVPTHFLQRLAQAIDPGVSRRALDALGFGVIAHTSGLVHRGEAGALNESFADVMGSLAKQWRRRQTARRASRRTATSRPRARRTIAIARRRYGSRVAAVVASAWRAVGVLES